MFVSGEARNGRGFTIRPWPISAEGHPSCSYGPSILLPGGSCRRWYGLHSFFVANYSQLVGYPLPAGQFLLILSGPFYVVGEAAVASGTTLIISARFRFICFCFLNCAPLQILIMCPAALPRRRQQAVRLIPHLVHDRPQRRWRHLINFRDDDVRQLGTEGEGAERKTPTRVARSVSVNLTSNVLRAGPSEIWIQCAPHLLHLP